MTDPSSSPQAASTTRPEARIPKGFRDVRAADILARRAMFARITEVYERFGFTPLETPVVEYLDALGKHLPESDTPSGGVFAFRFEDEQWVALRYDLTAPLARFVAQNHHELPLPFRRYQIGPVYRHEKPDPGRYREFYQCDFDSVGAADTSADAEVGMILCEALEALGIERGNYLLRVSNRKVLSGLLESLGELPQVPGLDEEGVRGRILRSMDKLDKVGLDGVRLLLAKGRKDESGAFTPGAGLAAEQVERVLAFLELPSLDRAAFCDTLEGLVSVSPTGAEGVRELRAIHELLAASGYGTDRVVFDPTVVRGLDYYTGPVFEAVLTFEVEEDGERRQFGSVAGGGRYDGLVERFTGQRIPCTGASIGVDRLLAALRALGKIEQRKTDCPVLVTIMDKSRVADYWAIAAELRAAGIPTEVYVGGRNFKQQMKYADARQARVAIIAGSNEFEAGEVSVKDLGQGRLMAEAIGDRSQWVSERPAQLTVRRSELVQTVRSMLEAES